MKPGTWVNIFAVFVLSGGLMLCCIGSALVAIALFPTVNRPDRDLEERVEKQLKREKEVMDAIMAEQSERAVVPDLPPSSGEMPGYKPETIPPTYRPPKRGQGNVPPSPFSRSP